MLRNKVFLIVLFMIWVGLLALPMDWVNLTASIHLPGIARFSVVDLYQLFLCSLVFFGGSKDAYVNRATRLLLGGAYFLAIYGLSVGVIRGNDFRNLALDLRQLIGFGAGLGFARHLYRLSAKERAFLFSFFGTLMLIIGFGQYIHLGINWAQAIAPVYLQGYAGRDFRVGYRSALALVDMATRLLVKVPELSLYVERATYLIPVLLFLQMAAFMLNGVRSYIMVAIVYWILSAYAVYTAGYRQRVGTIRYLVTSLVLGGIILAGVYVSRDTLYYDYGLNIFFTSTRTRVVRMISGEDESANSRFYEIVGVFGELEAIDYIFGRGLGGTTRDYIGYTVSGHVRGSHIGIITLLWKFGVVGCILFLLLLSGYYYTLPTFLERSDFKQCDPAWWTAKISAAGILSWAITGAVWDNWTLLIVAIFSVDVYRYWLIEEGQ